MRQVIGLLGAKGSGKDTCAAYLVQLLGFVRIGFADALYREVAEAFGVTTGFLGNRDTKESPLAELALENCKDEAFVRCVVEELFEGRGDGFNLRTPLSPRVVMQLWGTEYRRRRGVDSYWLDIVNDAIKSAPEKSFVVTDVRFKNEFGFIHDIGGRNVRIRRPQLEAEQALERARHGTASHSSETELLTAVADAEVFNKEGQPDSLREGILSVIRAVQVA